jgi:hypothetical protein
VRYVNGVSFLGGVCRLSISAGSIGRVAKVFGWFSIN